MVLNLLGIELLNSYIEDLKQKIESQAIINQSKIIEHLENHKSYIIAQNWVTELYGILCNNVYSNSDEYCLKLDEQIIKLTDDDIIRYNNRANGDRQINDIHLEFLLSKHSCNVIIHTYIY